MVGRGSAGMEREGGGGVGEGTPGAGGDGMRCDCLCGIQAATFTAVLRVLTVVGGGHTGSLWIICHNCT